MFAIITTQIALLSLKSWGGRGGDWGGGNDRRKGRCKNIKNWEDTCKSKNGKRVLRN
jgi:hypothetical protein